tara:strand:+ start:685 stop:864 length:180 start_codon:yes stop_codon:yes gene_type:complete
MKNYMTGTEQDLIISEMRDKLKELDEIKFLQYIEEKYEIDLENMMLEEEQDVPDYGDRI